MIIRKTPVHAGITVFLLTLLAGCQSIGTEDNATAASAPDPERKAPRIQDLGTLRFAVTSKDLSVQQYFDQGLRLTYGFNHAEAIRGFQEAQRRDPNCAMAFWGEALALGPNINAPMGEDAHKRAYAAIQQAVALKGKVSPKESDFIDAMAARYAADPKSDRKTFDEAYAQAMEKLAAKYPDDAEAATLYVDSLMNLSPWNYWLKNGDPRLATTEFVPLLEKTIAKHPNHPGAHHLYIHAVEASDNPDRAVPSADILASLMPGAGHLVHMPSHIYIRVGQYEKAAQSNINAIAADEDYLAQCRAQGMYPQGYYPHNTHFLWSAQTWLGQSAEAIANAWKTATVGVTKTPHHAPTNQQFAPTPWFAYVRFGKWPEMLEEESPPARNLYTLAMWHYARGAALAATGKFDEARASLDALEPIIDEPGLKDIAIGTCNGRDIAAVAREVLAGEIAFRSGDTETAIHRFERGVRLEDGLSYNEPPAWNFPVRHNLGAALLKAGLPAEAETVYWEDLRRNRENGYALFGLMQALEAQGRKDEAALMEERFAKAWKNADIRLTGSCF